MNKFELEEIRIKWQKAQLEEESVRNKANIEIANSEDLTWKAYHKYSKAQDLYWGREGKNG